MIVVTVARKPLVEANVASNVLKHGCGAMHIDATRIGVTSDDVIFAKNPHTIGGFGHANAQVISTGRPSVETPYDPSAGRWPANIVLEHIEGCQKSGTRKMKSGVAGARSHGFRTDYVGGGREKSTDLPPATFNGPDGLEEVEVWDCASGCPVAAMDEQSGFQKSSGFGGRVITKQQAGRLSGTAYGDESRPVGTAMITHNDAGGASRFFKQIEGMQK